MELQHINVKLLADNGQGIDLEPLIPVFHEWIRDQVFDELLLDVADYRHVHEGPGVVLIGHQANYSVDNIGGRLGVRYNRKAPLDGTNASRIEQAARAALGAFQRLETEARLRNKLRFKGQDVEVFVNDRLLAPNTRDTREALQPELDAFCQKLFRGADYALAFENEPRRCFGVSVKAAESFSLGALLSNLAP